ncbi:kinase-like domain-containing protein [Fimicolochytrium jonesii]|uniref:kinase-like domain-containing protein n=1 Tax=Fimicolochytrium jonesii TaxID=1396493 RepID=UPI0022FED239|nr:kinase-like domain-containing protein [Fimicolochytrium jonesii]KAI8815588.1 kinase-like domain-containing protein [Fimicolochytrium jonesii]
MATITVLARTHRSTTSSSQWSHFVKDKKVGEGTYAVVYLGWAIPAEPAAVEKDLEGDDTGERDHLLRDKKVGVQAEGKRRIAMKKIKAGLFKDGLDMSAIREVKALQELKHPNVVELIDVYSHKTNLNLVLEYLDADLEKIIKNKAVTLSAGDIKSWMLMTLRGLHHCHNNFILHRDLKPNNLLLASDGQLKLADFGMARDYGNPHRAMTSMVVTRWYRSPELLLGAKHYGYAIDMWALQVIFRALGTPTESEWPGMTQLPDYHEFKAMPKNPLHATFTAASPDALTFLENLLVYDPLKRPTAEQALKHFYFRNQPRPTPPNKLPRDVGGAGAQHKAVAPDDAEAAARPGIKRKAPDFPDDDFEMGGVPGAKVARKLF